MRIVAALLALAAGIVFAPAAADADPNNTMGTKGLILVDKVGSRLLFFTPDTYKELASINVGEKPHEVVISPDRRTAYVAIYGDGVYNNNPNPGKTIAVVDIAKRKQIDTIDLSPNLAPHSIAIDRKGMLYVACDISRTLVIIDPKTKRFETIDVEGTGHFLAVTPDGAKAYLTNKNDRPFVSVVDTKAKKIVARIPATSGTEGVAVSPDGKRAAIGDRAGQIVIVDTATDAIVQTLKLEGLRMGVTQTRYSPDGKYLIATGASQAFVYNVADLSKQTAIPVGRGPAWGLAFAGANTMLVANHGEGTVTIVDLSSGKPTGAFPAGKGVEDLAFY